MDSAMNLMNSIAKMVFVNSAAKKLLSFASLFALPVFSAVFTSADMIPRVAVLGFSSSDQSIATNTDLCRTNLKFKLDAFSEIVNVGQAEIQKTLHTSGIEITYDKDAISAGATLKAAKVITGTVAKSGEKYTVTLRVLDVATGRSNDVSADAATPDPDLLQVRRVVDYCLVGLSDAARDSVLARDGDASAAVRTGGTGIIKRTSERIGGGTEVTYYVGDKVAAYEQRDVFGGIVSKMGDVPDGVVKSYWGNGRLQSEETFKGGRLNGKSRRYYDSGRLDSDISYKNSIQHGPSKLYYDSGSPRCIENYKNGQRDGQSRIYHANGKIKTEGYYKNRLAHGPLRSYDERGALKSVENYIDGRYIGGK